MNIKQQLRRLNVFGCTATLRITDAVWVVFLVSRGYSLWQVGLAEGIFHMVSLLCEIPSGIAADLIGRRRTLALSGLCGLCSALLMVMSSSFSGICLAMAFSALSCSLISGSDEALLYDSLVEAGQEEYYIPASARYTQVQNLGTMLSNAASLLASFLNYVGFYLLDAGICAVRALTALSLTEPTVTQTQAERQAHPFRDLGNRFWEHVSNVVGFLKNHPGAGLLILADGLVTLPSYLTLMFLQQRLSDLGVPTMWLGLPVMCIALARMMGTAIGGRLRPARLRPLYTAAALLVGFGTILAGAAPVISAVLGAMLAAGAMDVWMLHLQKRLNSLYPSDQRATLISVNMMAYSGLMVIVSPAVGWLGDITGIPGAGLCALGAVVGIGGLVTAITKQKKSS